jgi:HlyD family secretion protein
MATAQAHIAATPTRLRIIDTPQPAAKLQSRWLRWGVVAALVLALVIAGVVWRARLQNAVAYETVSVERGPIQARVTAAGNLNAVVDVLVSSQVSGNIKALYADWNSKVKKGQLVALIDPEIFQAEVDQANATYRGTVTWHRDVPRKETAVGSAESGSCRVRSFVPAARKRR